MSDQLDYCGDCGRVIGFGTMHPECPSFGGRPIVPRLKTTRKIQRSQYERWSSMPVGTLASMTFGDVKDAMVFLGINKKAIVFLRYGKPYEILIRDGWNVRTDIDVDGDNEPEDERAW